MDRSPVLAKNVALLQWLSIDEWFFAAAITTAYQIHVVGYGLWKVLTSVAPAP